MNELLFQPADRPEPIDKRPLIRARLSFVFNVVGLVIVIASVVAFGESGNYIHFGPSSSLSLVGVNIDTWKRWIVSVFFIVFVSTIDSITCEMGMPFLSFRIYNPDCKVIRDVGPVELQLLANGIYMSQAIKSAIYTLATVTQLDFALVRVLSSEIASFYTIRVLIREKRFE